MKYKEHRCSEMSHVRLEMGSDMIKCPTSFTFDCKYSKTSTLTTLLKWKSYIVI